jgi:hypothetical protein
MTECRHIDGGICHNLEANTRDGTVQVSVQRCFHCPQYEGPNRGLGDAVATVAKAVGFTPCGGCQKRREALNRLLPSDFGTH